MERAQARQAQAARSPLSPGPMARHGSRRKIHIGVDEKTLEIRAAESTTGHVGDAPMPPELPDRIPADQETPASPQAALSIPAGAAAIIPPRKNAGPWKADTAGPLTRNEALRASRHFGRAIRRRRSGCHRRSRVETKMHCVQLLGRQLTARDFHRQVAEFQVRLAVLNRFTALGMPVTEAVG